LSNIGDDYKFTNNTSIIDIFIVLLIATRTIRVDRLGGSMLPSNGPTTNLLLLI